MRGTTNPAVIRDILRRQMVVQGHNFLRVRDDRGRDLIWLGEPRRSLLPNTQVCWIAPEARPYREVIVQVDDRPLLARTARVLGIHLLVAAILAFVVYQVPMRALRHAIGEVENSHAQLVHSDRLSSIGEMYAGLAHEVNNPLGIMLTRVQLLIDGAPRHGLPADVVSELELVHRHGQRIAEIIRGLLAFARRTSSDMRPASLNAVLGDACLLVERAFAKQGITLERQLDAGLPEIQASPDQLLQVFVNLLTNARDAMPEGGTITLRSHRAPHGVVAEVQDTGVGITEEAMGRLFEPFFTTKEVGKGTGLGLAVSYGIVRAHRGDIEVRSAPGAGCRLPRLSACEWSRGMSQRPATILIVDDELDMAEGVSLVLRALGHHTHVEQDSSRALAAVQDLHPDLLITDLNMPGLNGLQLLELVHAKHASLPVMVLTGYASVESAVDAMKLGAIDYLAKPFSNDELVVRVDRILERARIEEENRILREQVEGLDDARQIVATTPEMQSVLHLIHKVAATDARVLLIGESGTGKELVARTIHRASPRARGPFFGVNCGALNENLLESELFGHERGAFTGAISTKRGIFEMARGGTLFLDEVSETTGAFQTELLRVVQESEFLRVGGTTPIKTDVRLIASSNRDPRQCVSEGRLREDLYYRLSVVQVRLPPLRERLDDITPLAEHFLRLYAAQIKKRVRGILPTRWTCCAGTPGRATSASWRT